MEQFEHYFTETEERQLFRTINRVDAWEAKRDYFWMMLMRQTGVRLGILAGPDARKAQKKGLDQIGLRVIDARESLDTGYLQYRAETNKRDKQHPIFLNKTARTCLEGLLAVHRKRMQGHTPDMPALEMPLILSRRNQAMSRRSFQARMEYWCTEAGVPLGTPHWLRHTWAKRYLARTDNPAALRHVQAVLGHSNIQTSSIYTVPDREDLQEAMRVAQ